MPNDNCLIGMACPECKSQGPFDIECKSTFTVWDDGTDLEYTGPDWEDDSPCSCRQCNHEGTVADFTITNQNAS